MDKEAQRIMARYPGHVPVICTRPGTTEDKKKFLIPMSMGGKEFAATVRAKCPWANADSCMMVDGKVLQVAEKWIASELHETRKAVDGFLHVVVTTEPVPSLSEDDLSTSATSEDKVDDKKEPSTEPAPLGTEDDLGPSAKSEHKADDKKEPCVFHMPDFDQEPEAMSAEAKRVRKVISKHPDLLPVLVRQAATAGLPTLNKKLLVPRAMSCEALQGMLPKHLGLNPDESSKWKALRIYMGDVPIMQEAMMSDVYEEHVDEDDGGLHLTVGLEGHLEAKEDAADLVAQQLAQKEEALAEARMALTEKDLAIEQTKMVAVEAITHAESRAHELEAQVQELMVTVQSQAIEASMHKASMEEANTRTAELERQLQESEEGKRQAQERAVQGGQQILKLQEELVASGIHTAKVLEQATLGWEAKLANLKELEDAFTSVDRMSDLLATVTAEKEKAQAQVKQLSERVVVLEAAQAKRAKKRKELEADGFVDLGSDSDGLAACLGDSGEFEVVSRR